MIDRAGIEISTIRHLQPIFRQGSGKPAGNRGTVGRFWPENFPVESSGCEMLLLLRLTLFQLATKVGAAKLS